MKNRPKLNLRLSAMDLSLEILGWTAIIGIWVLTLMHYSKLPDTIPIHYNASGEPDGFGGKGHILSLPIVSTILFLGITILNKFPHIFNYPTEITPENALKQYTNATRLLRYLKLIIAIIHGSIVYQTIRTTIGKTDGIGGWFLPLALGLIFLPLTFFVIKSFRQDKTSETSS